MKIDFAIECEDFTIDHIIFLDDNMDNPFEDIMQMKADDLEQSGRIPEILYRVYDTLEDYDYYGSDFVLTLVGEDNCFIWSINVDLDNEDMLYEIIDWQKDGRRFKYTDEVCEECDCDECHIDCGYINFRKMLDK